VGGIEPRLRADVIDRSEARINLPHELESLTRFPLIYIHKRRLLQARPEKIISVVRFQNVTFAKSRFLFFEVFYSLIQPFDENFPTTLHPDSTKVFPNRDLHFGETNPGNEIPLRPDVKEV